AGWNAVVVFSGAGVMAPRWPTIVISAVVVSGPVSVLVMGTILSGSRRDGGLFAAHAVAVAVQVRAVSRIALAHGRRAGRPGRFAVRVVHAAVTAALCGGGLRSRRRGGLRPTGLLLLRGDHVALARPGPGVAVALESGEALAAAEHALHRVGFGGFDPEVVLRLHRDLPRHVLAAVVLLRRQPGRGIASALLPVQARLDGEQVQRVVGELAARVLVPARGAGLPCVGQRHHVVDVDGAVRAIEAHGLAAVRGGERAQQHHAPARAGLQGDLLEVAAQDVVAGVAAVAVQVVAPAEGVAGVARLRGAALLLELG